MSLQDELRLLKERAEGNLPPKVAQVLRNEVARLTASGIEDRVAKPGTLAPKFQLEDQRGEPFDSQVRLAEGPLVVVFYRGFWCPYCNADLAHLNRHLPEVQAANGRMVAVSPEKREYSKRIIRRQKLEFDILADPHNSLAAEFGLRFSVAEDVKDVFLHSYNVNLGLFHGDDDWTLPIPARFLIDTHGVIRYSEGNADYRTRPEPTDLIDVLRTL